MNEHAIFLAALEIADPNQRARYLDAACADDPSLRKQVEALFAAHERSGAFLDVPVLEQLAGDSKDPNFGAETSINASASEGEIELSFLEPSTAPDSLGRLRHYEVREVIGRGGCGIVLKALDEKLERIVAVKVMAPELAATSPARKRFLREARAAAAVRHENVVSIYAVEEQPLPFLVMEYIDGETLQQRLDRTGPLDVQAVLRISQQIASGLAAAHDKGLVHRDIKPGNILLEDGTDHLKITDFGLARSADDASMTQSGVIAGTPLYMSPEQAQARDIDHRSDLFSLGSVLYVMCSGRPPFRAASTLAVMKRVVEDQPRPIQGIIPEVPQWLSAIIARLHAKQPGDRFDSARQIGDLLARCLAELEQHGRVELLPEVLAMLPQPADETQKSDPGEHSKPAPAVANQSALSRGRGWAAAAAIILLLLVGLGAAEATGVTRVGGAVVRLFSPSGTLIVEVDDPGVSVTIVGEELVITGAGVKEIRLKPGQYQLLTSKNGKVVRQELVTVTRNGRQVVRVSKELKGPPAFPQVPEAEGRATPPVAPKDFAAEHIFDGHTNPVVRVLFTPDGSRVVSASNGDHHIIRGRTRYRVTGSDNSIRVWSIESAREIRKLNMTEGGRFGPQGICLSPDGRLLAAASSWVFANGPAQPRVYVWDLSSGERKHHFAITAYNHALRAAGFSPDGKTVFAVHGGSGGIHSWSLPEGEDLRRLDLEDAPRGNTIPRITCSPDGRFILSSFTDEGDFHAWDAATGKVVKTFRGHTKPPSQVVLSSDGTRLLSCAADYSVRVWDWEPPREILCVDNLDSAVACVAFSPDGQRFLTGADDGAVILRDTVTGKETARMSGHTGMVHDVAFSPTGLHAASGGNDHTVRLLRLPVDPSPGQEPPPIKTADDQAEKLRDELRRRNPDFNGEITYLLEDERIVRWSIVDGALADLSPLLALEHLKQLNYPAFDPERDAPVLCKLTSLENINQDSAASYRLAYPANKPPAGVSDEWLTAISKLPVNSRVKVVMEKLQEQNPNFDGKYWFRDNDMYLNFDSRAVTDLSPLAALPELQTLVCSVPFPHRSWLSDLSPLSGMSLTRLECERTRVADVSPLQGMPLTKIDFTSMPLTNLAPLKGMPVTWLDLAYTRVENLAPLAGMPVTRLDLQGVPVADLSPLQGMPLQYLNIGWSQATDLSPLEGMPLHFLNIAATEITDLSPLQGMKLRILWIPEVSPENLQILRGAESLETINGKPAADFWSQIDAR